MKISVNKKSNDSFILTDYSINSDDRYEWLRDPNWPQSISSDIKEYLEQENDIYENFFSDIADVTNKLFLELKSRVKEHDTTVPIKRGCYYYYSYIKTGQEYWTHVRKNISNESIEEIVLDENAESEGQDFCKIADIKISPDHKLVAYSIDTNGSERYSIRIRKIGNQELVEECHLDTFGSIEWNKDSNGFYYIPTGESWRANEVKLHKLLGNEDISVFKENDETFWVSIEKSSSEDFLFITTKSGNAAEVSFINLNEDELKSKIILKRHIDHIYYVTHHNDYFYIVTNDRGKNYRLVKVCIDNLNANEWCELIEHNEQIYLYNVVANKGFLILEKKVNGLPKIQLINYENLQSEEIIFNDQSYDISLISTDYAEKYVRYEYSSLVQPSQIIDYNTQDKSYTVLKTQEIPSGYQKDNYITKRLWASSKDGIKIPLTILYKSDLKFDSSNPVYLYGYGAYGISVPLKFRSNAISLVDRGFIYAIAHIRGGDDLGYEWYESAKFLNKKRTFEDFLAVAEFMIQNKFTSSGNISICGGSAGGMLIGYCINNASHLFKAAVLHVPFVDVLATMLDESLPLTQIEFKEWGNPKDTQFYDYIKSYSPFDNICVQHYPHIMITSGLNDPRVTYWEAAKFALKLRNHKLDDNTLVFKTNMSVGHSGKSGRYDHLAEIAQEYAFIIHMHNK